MNTTPQSLLSELQQRVSELFRSSPAADIERNLKAMLAQTFQRVDLVTRDEFDTQLERLTRLHERIESLELRLAQLQARSESGTTRADTPAGQADERGSPAAAKSADDAIPMPGPSASPDDSGPVI